MHKVMKILSSLWFLCLSKFMGGEAWFNGFAAPFSLRVPFAFFVFNPNRSLENRAFILRKICHDYDNN